jgi:hypothetical protein
MRKTNFTLVPTGRSSRKANGKHKTTLTLALFFLFALVANQLQAQCSISCKNVNISVGQSCEADLNWSTLAYLPQACNQSPDDEDFTIIMNELDGTPIDTGFNGNLLVDLHDYLNDSVVIEVYYDDGAGNNNFCWTSAYVEDKMPPFVDCKNDTLSCLEGILEPFPDVTDNCSDSADIEIIVRNRSYQNICTDDFIKIMIREFQAQDAAGNLSALCTDTIYYERIDSSLITPPTNYEGANALACDDPTWDINGDGYPDVAELDVPSYNGLPLFPDPVDACNLSFTFKDHEFPISCGTKIVREWTGLEWCNGSDRIFTFIQIIKVLDEEPPVVVAQNDFIEVTTSHFSCSANVIIPPATVTDNCSEISSYQVSTNAPGIGVQEFSSPSAAAINLPIGTWDVVITAFDDCYLNNGGSDTVVVNVVDNTPPVPVCDQNTSVSLTIDGRAKVFAASIDDGSYDECGPIDTYEVARMGLDCDGEPMTFRPFVEFCCEDIPNNPIQVILRVTDESGNSNECMVNVEVQDKLPASIEAPDDITVTCQFPFDEDDLFIFGKVVPVDNPNDIFDPSLDPRDSIFIDDPGNDISGPELRGLDGFAYDNCEVTIDVQDSIDIESCGTGTIRRTFMAMGAGNIMQAIDVQTITFINPAPFEPSNIDFPEDVVLINNCNLGSDLTPDFIESEFPGEGFPTFEGEECAQVATSFNDALFPIDDPNDPACFKILRTWKILDWCTYETGGDQPYESTQVIKVMNNVAPEFTLPCTDTSLISIDGDCDSRFVDLIQDAEDDCTANENLVFDWRIDAFNDGSFDFFGTGKDASDDYPVGSHRIQWSVSDQCGNVTTCSYIFTILSEKGPTPICRNLTVGLMPVDSDGDGEDDEGMLDIFSSQFDAGSFHACGFDVTTSFSEDPMDTVLTLTCEDLGSPEIEIWVHAENGTQSFCRTYVIVQANNACGPDNNGPTFPIAGNISNPISQEVMSDLDVALEGAQEIVETDDEGNYKFSPMPEGGQYKVMPDRTGDILNGVSTFDILLIQQHILGMNQIESPYTLIAADVNNDSRITGSDIIDLRKAILGITTEFPNNTSWRYANQQYQFSGDPLNDNFDEHFGINNLNSPMTGVDFYAMKVGDINGSVSAKAGGRSNKALNWTVDDVEFEAGESFSLPVRSSDFEGILGFQMTLEYNSSALEITNVNGAALELSSGNVGLHTEENAVTLSWNDVEPYSFDDDEVLLYLEFTAKRKGTISSALSLTDRITKTEAYDNTGVKPALIQFRSVKEEYNEFALFQNSPNPFTDQTVIGFVIPKSGEFAMSFFNGEGRELLLIEKEGKRGYNQIQLSAGDIRAEGVIYYKLESGDHSASKKMVVVK